ncbi:hypothetical protein [Solibacillus sp. FSL H8-0538]|uniref:hypothetical protein n=1 Tax=Solibacillus sp. FSL H8-0538 TaxID=2921400 RepID=UPI0030FC04A9
MTNNDPKTQYNGIILLTSYLQRVFVAETIYQRVKKGHLGIRYSEAKALLDETYTILPVVEKTKQLSVAQKAQLQLITEKTLALMKGYFKQMPLSFNDKLALVGSSLYGEQMMNNGVIRLGKLFNVEVNKDFHMRTQFYEDRTKMVDFLVNSIHHNEQPDVNLVKPIETWVVDILRQKDYVLADMNKISEMIGF